MEAKRLTVADMLAMSVLKPLEEEPEVYMDYTGEKPEKVVVEADSTSLDFLNPRLALLVSGGEPDDDEAVRALEDDRSDERWEEFRRQDADRNIPIKKDAFYVVELRHPIGELKRLTLESMTGGQKRRIATRYQATDPNDGHVMLQQAISVISAMSHVTEATIRLMAIGDYNSVARASGFLTGT